MRAHENSFLCFLEGKKQFIIPVYQRPYSWRPDSCAQLWEDIIQITTHQEQQSHFMGSILYTYYGQYSPGGATKLEIVDGQQRIVTLSLLLAAIANVLNDLPNSANLTKEDIYSYYLINPYAKGTDKYKMHLTQNSQNRLFLFKKKAIILLRTIHSSLISYIKSILISIIYIDHLGN